MRNSIFVICSAAIIATACASPNGRVINSYRAPGTVSFVFDRGAVFVLNGGPELRASLEDEVIRTAARPRLVAGHTVVSSDEMRSIDGVRDLLIARNVDGILVMRIVRESEIDSAASKPGESFITFADSAGPDAAAFGEGNVGVEASMFRVADQQLVWRGIAKVPASKDPLQIARDAVSILLHELRSRGLVHD